ncbi:MAG: aminotransferase class III-fold pyridoxal phosphate-dependent enzyme [Hyphomicrobium sp.]
MATSEGLSPEAASLIARRWRTFGPTSMLFYKRPLNLVRGEGVWLFEADGTRYLDAYNNVPSCGHCHPKVVSAVTDQMGTLNTHTRYLYGIVYTYAERLLATFPAELSNIVFTCTGSESVDLALRIARTVTGGTGFIATENAYHGNTSLVTEVSPSSASAEQRPANIFLVPAPDTYRHGVEEASRRFTQSVAQALRQMKEASIKPAAMIADSILSSDGVYPGEKGFLNDAASLMRQAGGLYVADEVQPGFGRTGESMWGFQRHGIVPDLVVMGKPMGNGYPIGGVVAKPAHLAAFGASSGYFNTFGGSPVAAAAGLAVLDVLESEGLQANARETGSYLLAGLQDATSGHDRVGDVRGAGLYVGFEFVRSKGSREPDQRAATFAVNALRERGILIGTAGLNGNILKIRPPLCFMHEHADQLIDAMKATLSELE